MKKKIFSLLFIAFTTIIAALNAGAQGRMSYDAYRNNQLLANYIDSLNIYKARIDSLNKANDSLRAEMGYPAENKYFRYFAPLAYYPDITGRMLTPYTEDDEYTDGGLMQVYLKHPELVQYSANQFSKYYKNTKDVKERPNRIELTKHVKEAAPQQGSATTDIPEEQIDMFVTKPHFWTFSGDYYLQFLQNYISPNWYKSGASSYSMMGTVTLKYNYNNKQKIKWDNMLELRLGFQTTDADTINKFKTSDDLIRYTSKLGLQAHEKWYYTLQVMAYTQFTKGLKNNDKYVYSDFMSPFNLNVSIGMDYTVATKNKKLTGSVHIAPFAFKFRYVDRKYLASSFGINNGHRTMEDFGSQFNAELTWTPFNNFKWKTRLYGYTTYHKYEMEWENTLTLQFNKYISTCLYLYPRFDDSVAKDDKYKYFQFKEYFSFGFSYSM